MKKTEAEKWEKNYITEEMVLSLNEHPEEVCGAVFNLYGFI